MKLIALSAAVLALALAGCAAPLVSFEPVTAQHKVDDIQDWQRLAKRAIFDLKASQKAALPKVFVAPGPADMPFAAVYHQFLEQELILAGFEVVKSSPNALVLNLDVKTYLYGHDGRKRPFEYLSPYSLLYAWGTDIDNLSWGESGWMAVGGALVFDALDHISARTQAEALITITIADAQRTYWSRSEAMYVRPTDLPFYMTKLPDTAPQSLQAASLDVVRVPVLRGVGR